MEPRRGGRFHRDHYHSNLHRYTDEHDTNYSDYIGFEERESCGECNEYDSFHGPSGEEMYSSVFSQGPSPSRHYHVDNDTQIMQRPQHGLVQSIQYSRPEPSVYSPADSYATQTFQRLPHSPFQNAGSLYSRPIPTMHSSAENRSCHLFAQGAKGQRQIPTIYGQGHHKSQIHGVGINERPRRQNRIIPIHSQTSRMQMSGTVSAGNQLSSPKPLLSMQFSKKSQDKMHVLSPKASISQLSQAGYVVGNTVTEQSVHGKANLQGKSSTTVNQQSQGSQISSLGLQRDKHFIPKYQATLSSSTDTTISKQSQVSYKRTTVSEQLNIETHENMLPNSDTAVSQQPLYVSPGNQSSIQRKQAGSLSQNNQSRPGSSKILLSTPVTPVSTSVTPVSPVMRSGQSGIISKFKTVQDFKLETIVTKTKDDNSLGSHLDFNIKGKQNRPKVLIEVELVSKLKNIKLCSRNDGIDENKDLLEKNDTEILHDENINKYAGQKGEFDSFQRKGTDRNSDKTNVKKVVKEERIDKCNRSDRKAFMFENKSVKTDQFSSPILVSSNTAVSKPGLQHVEKRLNEELESKKNMMSGVISSANDQENEQNSNSVLNDADEKVSDNSESDRNRHETEKPSGEGNETGQLKPNLGNSLQKRVLEKLKNRTSLVKKVNELSLKLLAKNKMEYFKYDKNVTIESLEVIGINEQMSDTNDISREMDSSFDYFSDADNSTVKLDLNLTENSSLAVEIEKVTAGLDIDASSGQLQTVERAANEKSGVTEEISDFNDNVNNKLGEFSNKEVDVEHGDVDMCTSSTGILDLETEGTNDMLSRDASIGLCKDFDIDDSTEMDISIDSFEESPVDNHNIIDDQNELYGTTENEAVPTNEGLEGANDAQLRKKFNVKDVTVKLWKIDTHGREKEINQQKTDEIDEQNKPGDDKQLGASRIETVDNSEELQNQFLDVDQLDDNICTEKELVAVKRGQRQVVPLSERFSQLNNKCSNSEKGLDADENVYKAEFENIVNRLSKRSELNDQTGIKLHNEDMEIEYKEADKIINEAEMVMEHSQEPSVAVKNDRDDINKNDEDVNINPLQDGNCEGSLKMNEERGYTKDIKLDAGSPVSFLDYSDESDDELLRTPAAFLRSIEEINGRPVVITPTKVMDCSQNSTADTSSSDLSPVKPIAQRPGVTNKFTLDGLLADHEEKVDLVREMDEINQQLQDEIRQGGFVNILNREDAATDLHITEEQKKMLKQFEVEESRIFEDRPGVVVFQPQHYKCLFSGVLHPTHCGFTVGSNGLQLEKHIESLLPTQYKRVITSGIISQCFTRISCQTPLMRWLFFIMSIHNDYQVQQGCKKILLEILHHQHIYGPQKWAPRLIDVVSVLVNYGASLESIVPCGSNTLEINRNKLMHEPGYTQQPVQQNAEVNVENLILVLQILAQCLNGQRGRYSPNELSLLCVALCKASLDTSLKNMCAKGAFQNCVTMVIRQYMEADWLKERLKLTRMLVSITDHHHNSAHIAELLPPGQRGTFLQRGFCYLVLSEIFFFKTNVSDEVLNSIQIRDLKVFVPKIEELLEKDTYKMSSVVTLIDLCVGVHVTMNSEQREQLKSLLEQVRRVRVRDNISMLDRTRVKDMIVRMTSKWALDIQTMKGKQTKIFEYASPVKMHIEPVKTFQSSGEEDEEHSDSDDALPCKIQKLSQNQNS